MASDLHLSGAFGGIRTPNLLIRSQMLYPLSYERLFVETKVYPSMRTGPSDFAEKQGFEPWDQVSPVNSLAVSPIRPLSHFSVHSRRGGTEPEESCIPTDLAHTRSAGRRL